FAETFGFPLSASRPDPVRWLGRHNERDGVKELAPMLAAGEINGSLSDAPAGRSADGTDRARRVKVAAYRLRQWLSSPRPSLVLAGFGGFFGFLHSPGEG